MSESGETSMPSTSKETITASKKKTPGKPEKKFTIQGNVFSCGRGAFGQLGENVVSKKRFRVVGLLASRIVQIVAGDLHTVCLCSKGHVWTFGCNEQGALGRPSRRRSAFIPGRVTLDGKVVQISAGDAHTAALTTDGRVYIWGMFRDCQGAMRERSEPLEDFSVPRLVNISEPVIKVSSGGEHILFLTAAGRVWSAGCSDQGQLGRLSQRMATRTTRFGLARLVNPEVVHIKACKNIMDIWATQYGSFVKDRQMGILSFGLNDYGQLGLMERDGAMIFTPLTSISLSIGLYNWVKIVGSTYHTLLLDHTGKVYVLGHGEYGRLGLGENRTQAPEPALVTGLLGKQIVDIGCGSSVSYAVAANGDAFAWGFGSYGQLGSGDHFHSWEPQLIEIQDTAKWKIVQVDGGSQHAILLASR